MNGSVFNRARVDNAPFACCPCRICAEARVLADWSGYVPSIPRRGYTVKLNPFDLPDDLVTFADLAEGEFFSNAGDEETLFVKRDGEPRTPYTDNTNAVWVADPDGAGHAGKRCYINDDREVIPRDVSFKFD